MKLSQVIKEGKLISKWVPLHLDDVRPETQERPGSGNSSRCQPETNKSSHKNRRSDTRSWRRDREKGDDQDEVSSARSEGGNIRGSSRGRGRGRGREEDEAEKILD
ncbi:La-related protein 1B [Myotis brandtii]|uniref:La-related protein 1B n=1 Tax=Myotis brandtii TaxID=109478 RepID=S7NEN1_MYOBR|nr:La-related protein 1B [Myotis brandtii]